MQWLKRLLKPWRRRRRIGQLLFLALFLALFWKIQADAAPRLDNSLLFLIDPLVMGAAMVAARTLVAAGLVALLMLVLTALFGRFFCGWICPLGSLLDIFGPPKTWTLAPMKRRGWWRHLSFVLLAVIFGAALGGVQLAGHADPFALLTRGGAQALAVGSKKGFDLAYAAGLPDRVNRRLLEPAEDYLKNHLSAYATADANTEGAGPATRTLVRQGVGCGLGLLLAIWLLEFIQSRFWCRCLCPLGAVYRLAAWRSWLRRTPAAGNCRDCGHCTKICRMGAFDEATGKLHPSECTLCMDCQDECPRYIIRFSTPPKPRRGTATPPRPLPSPERRSFLLEGLLGTTAAVGAVALGRQRARVDFIRPPGAVGHGGAPFLDRCIRCGACAQACPEGVIRMSVWEGGFEAMFAPRLLMRYGYCAYNCNRCLQVCPTGALARLPIERKQASPIGKAFVDPQRCLPYAKGETCITCEEHCPVPAKAIKCDEVTATRADGSTYAYKRPWVDAGLCIGCGICENKCPVEEPAGIRVVPLAAWEREPSPWPLDKLRQFPVKAIESGGGAEANPYGL